jgi:hypothetical protein
VAHVATDDPWVRNVVVLPNPDTFDSESVTHTIAISLSRLQGEGSELHAAERTGDTWDEYRVLARYRHGEAVLPTGHTGSCQAYVTVDESDCTCL